MKLLISHLILFKLETYRGTDIQVWMSTRFMTFRGSGVKAYKYLAATTIRYGLMLQCVGRFK